MGWGKAYLARPEAVGVWRRYCFDLLVDALETRGVQATLCKTTQGADGACFSLMGRSDGVHKGLRHRGPDWDVETITFDD